jgi:hypothetical protein
MKRDRRRVLCMFSYKVSGDIFIQIDFELPSWDWRKIWCTCESGGVLCLVGSIGLCGVMPAHAYEYRDSTGTVSKITENRSIPRYLLLIPMRKNRQNSLIVKGPNQGLLNCHVDTQTPNFIFASCSLYKISRRNSILH